MRLLLDTHVFIWWADQQENLTPTMLTALSDDANELVLSVASIWEMQTKAQLGKLKISVSLKEIVGSQVRTNDLTILPVNAEHILILDTLPFFHTDPFDRLLIAQSLQEDLTIVSLKPTFSRYPIRLLC